jgi:hypothetical protein
MRNRIRIRNSSSERCLDPQLREPAGADRCLFCHAAEVQGYSRSAMAHALRRAGQEPDGIVSRNGTKITIHSSATGYWWSWENGGDKVPTALTL